MSKSEQIAGQTYALGECQHAVQAALEDWRANGKVKRLWAGDTSLWSGTDEDRWLGWLHEIDDQKTRADRLRLLADDVHNAGFKYALLLGMGGSSLCADVMKHTFGAIDGFPELFVLDSTVPAQIYALEKRIELDKTLFIVSSKSGGTTEPNAFKQFFYDRVRRIVGPDKTGSRFIAITDPGTSLQKLAQKDQFRHVIHGVPSVGGRYSAMSNFGTVPAAIIGIDVPRFLDRARHMARSCGPAVTPQDNPGVTLGLIMGALAGLGRDKLTLITSPGIAALGTWLEQLIAESTGKTNKGSEPFTLSRHQTRLILKINHGRHRISGQWVVAKGRVLDGDRI
jgi:glucose-6-phosphate isomerase